MSAPRDREPREGVQMLIDLYHQTGRADNFIRNGIDPESYGESWQDMEYWAEMIIERAEGIKEYTLRIMDERGMKPYTI